ncbi:MAG: patatin-like phospholipase family protein [bacterium]
MSRYFKLGLALGGGAARGLAHIGILKVLESEGILPDMIVGSSMGALIGAMYALEPDAVSLERRVRDFLGSEEFKRAKFDFLSNSEKTSAEGEGIFYRFSNFMKKKIFYGMAISRLSFISEETFAKNIGYVVDDIDISNTKVAFGATAVDINTCEELLITKGSIRQAVMASAAIPGILPPIRIDGKICIDGGWTREVPMEDAYAMGADYVIGVDVGSDLESTKSYMNSLDIVCRADAITRSILKSRRLASGDFIIRPAVESINWADFKRIDDCITAGERAARECLPALKRGLAMKKWKSRIRHVFWMQQHRPQMPPVND